MASLPVNLFDAVVGLCLIVAIVAGFRSGLLRSMATIFGYIAAMPVAVAAAPRASQILIEQFKLPQAQPWLVLAVIFLVVGIALSALLRMAVSETVGPDVTMPDRAAGAALGAVRVALLAVLLVVVFDRIIPAGRDPAFLRESRLRPVLSRAGREGLKSLPPDVTGYIDRMKRERGM
jgi:membrane protein required for colicin V production